MSEMVALYGFGGGRGASLTVTAPAGATVTVSKDGKTKTKAADDNGLAVFRGLSSGDWTVNMTDGAQTSVPRTVTIASDYAVNLSRLSLYKDGKEYAGGIAEDAYIGGDVGSPSASITKNADNVSMAVYRGKDYGHHGYAYMYTAEPVELTFFREIQVTVSQYTGGLAKLMVSSTDLPVEETVIAQVQIQQTGTTALSIEGIDAGYVCVVLSTGNIDVGSGSMTVTSLECVG